MASVSADGSKHFPPLRGTCNRCRELKVRCRTNISNSLEITAGLSDCYSLTCLRCLRAGAVCTYSPKRRSGRPPGTGAAQSVPSVQHGSSELGLSENLGTMPSPSTSTSSTPGAGTVSGPSHGILHTAAWSALPSSASQQFTSSESPSNINNSDLGSIDFEIMELLDQEKKAGGNLQRVFDLNCTDVSMNSVFDGGNDNLPPAPLLTSPIMETWRKQDSCGRSNRESEHYNPCDRQFESAPDFDIRIEIGAVEKQITELGTINLDIYHLLMQVRAEEIQVMPTHCDTMTKIARSFLGVLGDLAANSSRDELCDYEADCATLILALSCYQRLVQVFQHICCLIQAEYEPTTSATAWSSHYQLSTAQVVMTTELISHLLERLDRGLQRLSQPHPSSASSSSRPQSEGNTFPKSRSGITRSQCHCVPENRQHSSRGGFQHTVPLSRCTSHTDTNSATNSQALQSIRHQVAQTTEKRGDDTWMRTMENTTSSQMFMYEVIGKANKENAALRARITSIKRSISQSDEV